MPLKGALALQPLPSTPQNQPAMGCPPSQLACYGLRVGRRVSRLGLTVGTSILFSHIPDIAIVSDTSDKAQNVVRNHSNLSIAVKYWVHAGYRLSSGVHAVLTKGAWFVCNGFQQSRCHQFRKTPMLAGDLVG